MPNQTALVGTLVLLLIMFDITIGTHPFVQSGPVTDAWLDITYMPEWVLLAWCRKSSVSDLGLDNGLSISVMAADCYELNLDVSWIPIQKPWEVKSVSLEVNDMKVASDNTNPYPIVLHVDFGSKSETSNKYYCIGQSPNPNCPPILLGKTG